MTTLTALESSGFVRTYGQPAVWPFDDFADSRPAAGYRQGVASDHLAAAAALEGVRVVAGALSEYVVDDAADGAAYPVLCSEVIEVLTEDGPSDGRCGALATDQELGSCAGHADERRQWVALSEAEKAAWERAPERAW